MSSLENYEKNIIENSWKKLKETAEKSGYRDGISKGRELNYQNSFDEGYKEGLKNGFAFGLYKGVLSGTGVEYEDELEKVSRGNCNICKNKELENKTISEIICIQTEDSNRLLNRLHDKSTIGIDLPNKIL